MKEIVGIKFKQEGKIYYFDPKGNIYNEDDKVIVDSANGLEFGVVAICNKQVDDSEIVSPLKSVVRIANDKDISKIEYNRKRAIESFGKAEAIIKKHKLDMKLLEVEYSFDGQKLLLTFSSDERVDFRDLLKDLASEFKTRIELRQVGARDEAKLVGGLGHCGRQLCCNSFLKDFNKVSIKMAKVQGLSLNPTKINGLCGKLMCCLAYENNVYSENFAFMPKVNSFVVTPDGRGTVMFNDLLRKKVTVKIIDKNDNVKISEYELNDLKVEKTNGSENKNNQ